MNAGCRVVVVDRDSEFFGCTGTVAENHECPQTGMWIRVRMDKTDDWPYEHPVPFRADEIRPHRKRVKHDVSGL